MLSTEQDILELQKEAEAWDLEKTLRWGLSEFGKSLAIAASFGAEDVVLIDQASKIGAEFRVFTLDTDFLFPETYALMDKIEERYAIRVERIKSELTPTQQAARYGEALWASKPDQCCQLRKVEPLTRMLSELKAWVTGVRRDQAPTRANTRKLEWDSKFGLFKLNPIADWNWNRVWDYIRANDVPYNPLHDKNYPSIGCTYCTRPVQPGEDPRAGRWSGFAKTECGLHIKS